MRTLDKKEIDFILKKSNQILPLEVKLNFSRPGTKNLEYFKKNYKIKEYITVGLIGDPTGDKFVFPWQI